jgi:damage-control phosphatase, subfamily I
VEFREHFENAPVIIAKGQANYETLGDAGTKVFCLLQAKCSIIGLNLGVPKGSIIARQSTCA